MAKKDAKKGIVQEFQEFISRGNVIDLAVGVIVGGAFTSLVNALVEHIIRPFISFVTGGDIDVPGLAISLRGNVINFGAFISAVITFLITAVAVFAIVKAMNSFDDMREAAARKVGLAAPDDEDSAPVPRICPYCKEQIAQDAIRCPHCTSELEGM
ncbi:large conductance mechanosensitive channel protein [Coriobacterium glomerans PW2]|uniref:Large-conductance mechanosensitive channel n=1 Tax=Coriobacterium glomerans (strain ATCC 49209 / DSM 20642 / JCM 10262 / PW2) TaxID=700015 RepID=F2NBU2_CORGP|nr:large conductance mechanosensitive channel protein MscL [Coriobacterium glomerans]AEB06901.1 large conductance mechanosensitive channel protein [Coriobacterium glomerans PW2]